MRSDQRDTQTAHIRRARILSSETCHRNRVTSVSFEA